MTIFFGGKKRTKARARLGEDLHPTHRKVRDGWGTRALVAEGRRTDNSKGKCGGSSLRSE
jgi:hypothetical protein